MKGPQTGTSFRFIFGYHFSSRKSCTISKVASFVRWIQWLLTQVLAGDDVVLVNIDETPIYKQLQPRKGYVIRTETRRNRLCYARIPLRDRRGQATLVGCIVNDPDLQSKMPQFLLTNDKLVSAAEKAELATLAAPIRWIMGTKGWVTANAMTQLCTAYRRAIRSERPNAEIVLIMDCATIHTADNVLTHCSRLGIHNCLVPGGMTNLCQMLDTHAYALFKKDLSERQEKARGEHPLGILDGSSWIHVLCQSIRSTLVDRNWAYAFAENGMGLSLETLRPRLAQLLQVHIPLPPGPPDELDIETILGRKRELIREKLLRASIRALARKRALRLPAAARLPPARPFARAVAGAASSSSAAVPPLPPPADPPPADPPLHVSPVQARCIDGERRLSHVLPIQQKAKRLS